MHDDYFRQSKLVRHTQYGKHVPNEQSNREGRRHHANQRHSFLRAKNAKSHRVKPGRLLFSPAGLAGNIPTVWPSSIQWSHSSAALRHDNNKHGDLAVGPTFWRFVDVCYSVWTFSNKPAITTGVVPNSRNVSRATRSPIKPFPVFNFTPCMSLPLLALFWVCIPL